MSSARENIISELRKDILLREGFRSPVDGIKMITGLEPIEASFPNGVFPTGAIHEFLTEDLERLAVSGGFIAGLLGLLMKQQGISLWIGTARRLFPASLKTFGIDPDRIIFIDLQREKDVLWAAEEALKCKGITAVIAEVRELTFMRSRRLQLAVEASKVTGFILRTDLRYLATTACTSRWQITPLPSRIEEELPGVGFPRWQVELQRVRNGKPGKWTVEWSADQFMIVEESRFTIRINKQIRQTG